MEERLNMSLDEIIKVRKMTPAQKAKLEKKQAHLARVAKEQAEAAERKAEKARLKEARHAQYLIRQEAGIKESIAKLRREVSLEFDIKTIMPTLEAQMAKHGKIEKFLKSPIGARVRYEDMTATQKALKAKKIFIKLPVPVYPAEIKHHAVYFNAPEEMGEIDDEILSQIQTAMGAHGTVVCCKKKGRSVVIFFDDKQTRDGLISVEGNSEVTVEIGDHSVALHAGLPPNIRKRRKQEILAKKKAAEVAEKARASGQPLPKMMKSE